VSLREISHSGVELAIELPDDGPARLLHVGARPFDPATVPDDQRWAYRLVELRASGEDHDYIEAGRYAGSAVGARLRPTSVEDEAADGARRITVVQRDDVSGLEVTSALIVEDGTVESRTSVVNRGAGPVTLEAVSSFFLAGISKEGTLPRGLRAAIHVPRSGWYAESQWTRALASDLGLNNRFAFGSRHETIASVGSWCSSNFLPMGHVENVESGDGLMWEILHGGSWSWQIGESAGELYLHVAGPTATQSHWQRTLSPGDRFEAVPAVVAPAPSFDEAAAALTRHRRRTRKVRPDGSPVLFNDYMNCLMGDPSEAKVLPLIDVAAELGAEIYCLDAGWYLPPGQRWSSLLGHWRVDPERFPNGLKPVMDRVRERGMVPGLWFEIEAMTASCPGFGDLPDDWFLVRNGKRVVSHRRFHLDFRNPAVRDFADEAIDMAVGELGCGFLKLDYNFDSGPGSELGAESLGQALLDYEAAFLGWLDAVRARHPELMIEHCASGGQRLGRPFLERTHNASNSDEGDPLQVARIAAASTTIILPEQNGTWALPHRDHDAEMTAFTMLCALPYRMLLAGGSGDLGEAQRALVAEAVALHKRLRADFAESEPSWPLGLPGYHDSWICAALRSPSSFYVTLWRRTGGPQEVLVPLPEGCRNPQLLYPAALATRWSVAGDKLRIALPERSGRMFAFDAPEPERGQILTPGSVPK
jgi:alpha-galactosidase